MPKKGELINIDNLEEARSIVNDLVGLMKKLENTSDMAKYQKNLDSFNEKYEKLLNLAGMSAKKIEGNYSLITREIAKQIDKISELIDLTYDQIEAEAAKQYAIQQSIEARKQEAEVQKRQAALQKESDKLQNRLLKETKNYNSETKNISITDALKNRIFNKFSRAEENNKIIADIQSKVLAKYGGKITEDNYDDIKEEISDAIKKANLKEFGLGAEALKVGADTLKVAANIFLDLFKGGIGRQYDVFANTYTNVSTRTGITRSTYYNKQIGARNDILTNGWFNDVGTSEVMQAWDKMASQGINSADMFAYALDNVVTNKIVPYLDTTSSAFNILNSRLDGQFVKDIRGINKANLEIAGNNYLTQDMLQIIIDEMQPMSDAAIQNLAEGSAEFTSMINALSESMGTEQAKAIGLQVFKLKNYNAQMARNGSLVDKLDVYRTLNYDFADASNYDNIAGEIINNRQYFTRLGGNNNTGYGRMVRGTINEAAGISQPMSDAINSLMEATGGATGTQIAEANSTKTGDLYDKLKAAAEKDFKEGVQLTNEQKIVNATENTVTELAAIKEQIGKTITGIPMALLQGLGTLFSTWIGGKIVGGTIGKGIGALAGTGGTKLGASGLGAMFANPAGIVIAAASIAAIGATIAQKAMDKASFEHGKETATDTLTSMGFTSEQAQLSGNQAIGTIIGGLNDRGGFQKGWGNVTSGIGMAFSKIFQGKNDQAKNYLQWMLTGDIFEQADDTHKYAYLLTLAMEYANQNRLDAFNKGLQETGIEGVKIESAKDLGDLVKATGWSKSTFEAFGKSLKSAGWNLEGKMFEDIDSKKFGLEGINGFRQGLDYVPYDNYPAYLHEGEAVLTASTASELRSLLNEYRNTQQQTINLDAAIQEQTVALSTKLDQLITVVRTGSIYGSSSDKTTLVQSSIRNVRSTTAMN